jgi:hypothetical protein
VVWLLTASTIPERSPWAVGEKLTVNCIVAPTARDVEGRSGAMKSPGLAPEKLSRMLVSSETPTLRIVNTRGIGAPTAVVP